MGIAKPMGRTEFTNIQAAEKNLKISKLKDFSNDEKNSSSASYNSITQQQRNNQLFQDEYQYWRQQGQAHIVAYRKAVDYYRKFLKREVTVEWQLVVDEHYHTNEVDDTIELLQFNEVLKLVIQDLTSQQIRVLCYIIKQQDLDQYLNPELAKLVSLNTKNHRPDTAKEIADFMGLKTNNIGVSTVLYKSRMAIKEIFIKHGFKLGF